MSKIDLRFWKFGKILGDPTHNSCVQVASKGTQLIAVKILSNINGDESFDTKALLELDNQNLVKILDVKINQKLRYNSEPIYAILMEYCNDGDLENYINQQKLMDSRIILNIFLKWSKQIADGLFYLNLNQIVHGDLKTKNIFLTNNKIQAKIGDYDDRFFIKNGKIDSPNGTEGWQAPETLLKGIWSHKADVYSFGLILWSMYTLNEPENIIDIENEISTINNFAMESLLKDYCNADPENRKSIENFLNDFEVFEIQIKKCQVKLIDEDEYEIINYR